MWNHVSNRTHQVSKVFPFGLNANEFMLYGIVAYTMKNSKTLSVDWAARAHLVRLSETFKMDFYQVYLVRPDVQWLRVNLANFVQDSAPMSAAS
jgi:hypothetical protein